MGWWLRYRPGSEDVTGAVAWVSAQSTLVFWFNKNCTSRGSWGRRHRGTRGPARSRTRPGERRSVHKSAEMASRGCFGSFVYTVATREGHASVRGNEGVYTNRRKWPLGIVLGHLCTLLRLARARASGAAARLTSLPKQQPTQPPQGAPYGDWTTSIGTHRRKVRSLSARRAPLVRREMR